ncbi:hypothetical protein ACIB24_01380 [Spongisporangium articulatum]|uniref:Uncharacterized protein n=1 Tax=Spongisporangium articulatum TaxID=3362603 RepID=A0ABW8AJ99_9ACTN
MRPWNEIDWDQPRPSLRELIDSWPSITWEPSPIDHPAFDLYVDEVRAVYSNGGCLVGRWRATSYSDTTAWFMSRNRLDEYEMQRVLLDHPTVRDDLAELKIPAVLDRMPGGLEEQAGGSLLLDGLLARALTLGGAYDNYPGTAAAAKALAHEAVVALTEERYEDFRLDTTYLAWTPWFFDIAWDNTLVLTDMAKAEMTVICMTDTD